MRARSWLLAAGALGLAAAIAIGFGLLGRSRVPEGFAVANGRVEAEEIHVATKQPGRVQEVRVDEGDTVEAGQVVARMDSEALEARLREAEARLVETRTRRRAASAVVTQRESECELARKELERAVALYERKVGSEQRVDIERSRYETAQAACDAAEARVADAEAAIEAAEAQVARIQADLADAVLTAPRRGRVQYRLAEPGEVLGAGGRVVTLIDLDDVYMTFFLPERQAGRVRIGAEVRLVLDAVRERAIPARVSFVASEAQFTPKEVETAAERQKLSFRVKAQVVGGGDSLIKPGLPGVAWVRLDAGQAWPEELR